VNLIFYFSIIHYLDLFVISPILFSDMIMDTVLVRKLVFI